MNSMHVGLKILKSRASKREDSGSALEKHDQGGLKKEMNSSA